jgi:hypothetical protein
MEIEQTIEKLTWFYVHGYITKQEYINKLVEISLPYVTGKGQQG